MSSEGSVPPAAGAPTSGSPAGEGDDQPTVQVGKPDISPKALSESPGEAAPGAVTQAMSPPPEPTPATDPIRAALSPTQVPPAPSAASSPAVPASAVPAPADPVLPKAGPARPQPMFGTTTAGTEKPAGRRGPFPPSGPGGQSGTGTPAGPFPPAGPGAPARTEQPAAGTKGTADTAKPGLPPPPTIRPHFDFRTGGPAPGAALPAIGTPPNAGPEAAGPRAPGGTVYGAKPLDVTPPRSSTYQGGTWAPAAPPSGDQATTRMAPDDQATTRMTPADPAAAWAAGAPAPIPGAALAGGGVRFEGPGVAEGAPPVEIVPAGTPGPPPPEPKPRPSKLMIVLTITGVLLFAVGVAGIAYAYFGKPSFSVGSCVKQFHDGARPAKCSEKGAYQIDSEVDRQEKCQDLAQPVVILEKKGKPEKVLCLKPVTGK